MNINLEKELTFFERFEHDSFFKLKKRLCAFPFTHSEFLKLPMLFTPARFLRGKFRDKSLAVKYITDMKIVKKAMPDFFQNEALSFMGYTFKTLGTGETPESVERIFSAIGLISDIIVKDQYDLMELLDGRKEPGILDCGANIGIFSLFALRFSPDARIVAFEPAEETFAIMKALIEENRIRNILPVNLALGDYSRESVLLKARGGSGISNMLSESKFNRPKNADYSLSQRVKVETVDKVVFESPGIGKVDFIKIDTEGFERQILTGAAETIKKFKPIIACSAYHLPDDEKIIPEIALKLNPDYKFKILNKAEKDIVFY